MGWGIKNHTFGREEINFLITLWKNNNIHHSWGKCRKKKNKREREKKKRNDKELLSGRMDSDRQMNVLKSEVRAQGEMIVYACCSAVLLCLTCNKTKKRKISKYHFIGLFQQKSSKLRQMWMSVTFCRYQGTTRKWSGLWMLVKTRLVPVRTVKGNTAATAAQIWSNFKSET